MDDMGKISYQQLKVLARHMCIPVRQHHVTVNADGRFYFRTAVSRRYGLTTQWVVTSIVWSYNRAVRIIIQPYTDGIEYLSRFRYVNGQEGAVYFKVSRLGKKFVPHGRRSIRLRIIHVSRIGTDGTRRIQLRVLPTVDLYQLWQNITR